MHQYLKSEARHSSQRAITKLLKILTIVYLVGVHLRISIYSGISIIVPMYLMLFAAAAMGIIFFDVILRRIGSIIVVLILYVLAISSISFGNWNYLGDIILGSAQLIASIFTACALIIGLSHIEAGQLRRVFKALWGILMVLALLETFGLKSVFDSVRDFIYSGSGRLVYDAALRDIEIYGKIRTTVFASEPSFLADTLSSLALMVFFLNPERGSIRSWFYLFLMFGLSFLIAPSFKMVFYVIAVFVWQMWPRSPVQTLFLTVLVVALFAFGFVFIDATQGIIDAYAARHLDSGSFYGRIGVGMAVGIDALATHPLFGYGIGNTDGAYEIIAQAWSRSGAFSRFPWYYDLPAKDLMSNGFWWQWVYLGIGGGIVFNILIVKILRRAGVEAPFRSLFCSWIVWYAGAAFVDPVSWFTVVVFSVGSLDAWSSAGKNAHGSKALGKETLDLRRK